MSKGAETKEAIIREAIKTASVEGIEGLTIGNLASRLKMSKSGLFAHFGSKEALQEAVMETAAKRFLDAVWVPAKAEPRGLPRLRALYANWQRWMLHNPDLPGGCVLTSAATALDDKPGPVRDRLVSMQREWQATIAKAAELAVREGHFRADLDCEQFAFEMNGLLLNLTFHQRLLQNRHAAQRCTAAFNALVDRAAKHQAA